MKRRERARAAQHLRASAASQPHPYHPSDGPPSNRSSKYQAVMKCHLIKSSSTLQGSKQRGIIFTPRNSDMMNTEVRDAEGKCSKGTRNRHHLRKRSVTKQQKEYFFFPPWLKRHLKHLEILVNHKDVCQGNERNVEQMRHIQR